MTLSSIRSVLPSILLAIVCSATVVNAQDTPAITASVEAVVVAPTSGARSVPLKDSIVAANATLPSREVETSVPNPKDSTPVAMPTAVLAPVQDSVRHPDSDAQPVKPDSSVAAVLVTPPVRHDSAVAAATPAIAAEIPDSGAKQISMPLAVVAVKPPVLPVPVATIAQAAAIKQRPAVAVLAFIGNGVDEKSMAAITSRFESELLASDSFKVVERRNIDQILKEQGFQQSGACDNSGCSVEIGQLLSVQGIFTGEVSKVGKTWSLSVKRTDVGSGLALFSHVLDIQGSIEDVMRGGVPEMALIASGKKKPENNHTVLVARGSNSLWPWIAGGVVVVGGAAAAVVLLSQDKAAVPASNAPVATVTEPDQLIVRW